MAAVAPLYLTGTVLDVTYGRGMWWRKYRPAHLETHDLALDGIDFRAPEPDADPHATSLPSTNRPDPPERIVLLPPTACSANGCDHLLVKWTGAGRVSWPRVPCVGPLDDAISKLVRLAFFDRPELIPAISARLGILGCAGRPPAPLPEVWALAGIQGRYQWHLIRYHLGQGARAGGPPPALRAAIEVLEAALPATAVGCALALHDAGLTSGVLHPLAVLGLAEMWGIKANGLRPAPEDWAGTLFVGRAWSDERVAMRQVISRVMAAGVLPLDVAEHLVSDALPGRSRDAVRDVLAGLGLTVPGSPIVWHRGTTGRLLRPVQRLLAAAGPLGVHDIHLGLLRARHVTAQSRPDPVSPGEEVLLHWADEHPGFTVTATIIGLVGTRRSQISLLTRTDLAIVRFLRSQKLRGSVADLIDHLVESGLTTTRNAAKTTIGNAPYLMATGNGQLELRGRQRLQGRPRLTSMDLRRIPSGG